MVDGKKNKGKKRRSMLNLAPTLFAAISARKKKSKSC
jgi:hypothetical protein